MAKITMWQEIRLEKVSRGQTTKSFEFITKDMFECKSGESLGQFR